MTIWLRIAGEPARQFYRDARALPWLAVTEAKHALLLSTSALRSASTGETPNLTATLQNRDGQCSRLFAARPPIGKAAQILGENGTLFSGTVTRIDLDATHCTVEIAA
jgi:hypothetical protein